MSCEAPPGTVGTLDATLEQAVASNVTPSISIRTFWASALKGMDRDLGEGAAVSRRVDSAGDYHAHRSRAIASLYGDAASNRAHAS